MVFPFAITYNRRLKAAITADNEQKTLQYIKTCILDDKADNVAIDGLYVTYKGSRSIWRGSLFGVVDDGVFNLIYKENKWILKYQIRMHKLFIGTAIISSIVGIYGVVNGGPWWIGVAAFSWLCGANWITNSIRHDIVATDIAFGIDELICGKIEQPEQDKMTGELKSWF